MKSNQTIFESRLNGKLAVMQRTATPAPEMGKALLAERHGDQVAKLVLTGNQDAIKLVALREEFERYQAKPGANLNTVCRYERVLAELHRRLGLDVGIGTEIADLVETALSGRGFNSAEHLRQNLMEGLVLNVNTLGAKALSIPAGEYIVWVTGNDNTVLVPSTEAKTGNDQVLEAANDKVEINTRDLLKHWNKMERVIGELKATHKAAARGSLASAIDNSGMTQAELARRLGVGEPTVSRWVNRNEKKGSWRNPRFDHLKGLSGELRIDPENVMSTGPAAHKKDKTDDSDNGE